jgi:large subunit ribosomal protein L31
MKLKIHPEFVEAQVTCACGSSFTSYSTKKVLKVEICSKCHPLFTGQQKIVDAEGRVEKFTAKYRRKKEETPTASQSPVKNTGSDKGSSPKKESAVKKEAPPKKETAAKKETPAQKESAAKSETAAKTAKKNSLVK